MASILGTDERTVFSDSFGSLMKCFQRHKRLVRFSCVFHFHGAQALSNYH